MTSEPGKQASPSWYDLLDVAPDASADEIRRAWKAAIADLDPTDRRFRVLNQAAEVLLDPERRAAYDAELAGEQPEPSRPAPPLTDVEKARERGRLEKARLKARSAMQARARRQDEKAARETTASAPEPAGDRPRRGSVPAWALGVLAVLTAASVAAAAWLWFEEPSDAAVEQSTSAAQSAAERAVGPILSYDYRHLDEDQAAAESYMTPGYKQQYDQVFAVIKQNAPQSKSVVTGKVISSGIVRSGADRVEVLLFVDQPTTNKQHQTPVVYKNQVRAQMEKVGGDWLVDCLITTPNGHCD